MMDEINVSCKKVYTLEGLCFEDLELVCLALEDMKKCEPNMKARKNELIEAIDLIINNDDDNVQGE